MGNCSFKGVVAAEEHHHHHCCTRTRTKTKTKTETKSSDLIQVLSDSGRILQFREPISVQKILTDFPGFGVFRQPGRFSSPLSGQESLVNGQLYYILPLIPDGQKSKSEVTEVVALAQDQTVKTQVCDCTAKASSPARMSSVDQLTNGSALEVLPSKGNGVWRVKLVISTKQLEEIFSEQVNTEALIERMRSAASSSTESVTPRSGRSRNGWGVNWKPTLYSVFKVQNDSCSDRK